MTSPAAPASDPYLAWALATQLAGHSALAQADGYLPLLLYAPISLAEAHPRWRVPKHYRNLAGPAGDAPRFWTAWVPASGVRALAKLDAEYAMALPLRRPVGTWPTRAPEPPAPGEETPVIGVIDNGCAFLNQVFSEDEAPASSRFLSLWRQRPTAPVEAPWAVPADFGYGLELQGSSMQPGQEIDEAAAYTALGYPLDTAGRFSGMLHGTHVLDIAAGRPRPLLPRGAAAKPAGDDAASHARLVFVELPQPEDGDTTGAGLDAFIVDAVHYILSRAGPKRRVIINLSLGAQAGPHDGGSLVERALDALVQAHKGWLSICVAAGNGALEHWHAAGRLTGRGDRREARAGWRTVPGDTTDSFLELWAWAGNPNGLTGLSVTLTAPDGLTELHADLGKPRKSRQPPQPPALLEAQPGRPVASLDLRRMPAFSRRHRACALISLAPTAGDRAGWPAGVWQVTVRSPRAASGGDVPDCHVAFWLQRDTPGRSLREVLQSQLEGLSPGLGWNGAGALSHLAGARRVLTVGAARLSDSAPSSYSPQEHIDVWGTADESACVYGLLCAGGLSESVFRISGTSAATPMVVRALANGTLTLPLPRRGAASRPVGSAQPEPQPKPQQQSAYVAPDVQAAAVPAGALLVRPDGGPPGEISAGPEPAGT